MWALHTIDRRSLVTSAMRCHQPFRGRHRQRRRFVVQPHIAGDHLRAYGASRGGIVDKTVTSAASALADVPSGASLAVGGFGLCGVPAELIDALLAGPATDL